MRAGAKHHSILTHELNLRVESLYMRLPAVVLLTEQYFTYTAAKMSP